MSKNDHRTLVRQVYDAMAPGRWYLQSELIEIGGWSRGAVPVSLSRLRRWGAVERARDPDGAGWVKLRRGQPGHVWVYRRVEGFEPPAPRDRKGRRRFEVRW
jgi:hypothetical protein